MNLPTPVRRVPGRAWILAAGAVAGISCQASDPVLSFLDDESGLSFTYPPRWNLGVADQNGIRYRYLTAPKIAGDTEALSVTLISPVAAPSADVVAQPYLSGAVDSTSAPARRGLGQEWTFKDSSGVRSRLRVSPSAEGRFVGGWARGSETAMKSYGPALDALMNGIAWESPAAWPEERFASLRARIPVVWTRGSRLSNATNSTMQFKTLPLAVERGMATIHGFVTLAKEPVPPPGDLAAFNKFLKERASDTVAVLDHQPWRADATTVTEGYVDYLRSGNSMTSTRIRRWITVRNGVGLTFSCESRSDVFDRLDPWCRRVAGTVRLE